jgi:excisionase family DNA binding protein
MFARAGVTMTTVPSPLLDVTEAATYLRCSPSYLNKLRHTGGGPLFVKLGTKVLYRRTDLDRYIDKRVHKSTAA